MPKRRPPLRCYAVCAPGLAPLVAAELDALGVRPGRQDRGGVAFRASARQLYAANAWLRTATRVLVRLGSFPARSFTQLERGASELELAPVVPAGSPAHLRVTSTGSVLYHTDAIAERLASALSLRLVSSSSDPGFEAPLLVVRVARDKVTVSADSSGRPLYRRGWHVAAGFAPLRGTLAAAMIASIGWDGSVPLVDPFCGSGTIPIEAARLAAGLPPSMPRPYAFASWPSFEPGTWASVNTELERASRSPRAVDVAIVGSDRADSAIEAATANARAAGVEEIVSFSKTAVSALRPPSDGAGWLVTNPPYGKRTAPGADRKAGQDLRNLYSALGNTVRSSFDAWRVAMLIENRSLAGHSKLELNERFSTTNGGLDVSLLATPGSGGDE